MLRSEKKEFVTSLEGFYKQSSSVIVTHYHGLTVAEVSKLRKDLKENGADFKVTKNTLAKIAAQNSGIEAIAKLFKGPTAIAYSEDPVSAAKSVCNFAKTNQNLKIVGGIVNNQILDEAGVRELSKLPSLDELRGKIVGILQAPAQNILGVLQAPGSQVARVVSAYAAKK